MVLFPLQSPDQMGFICAQLPGGESVFRASSSHKCTVLLTRVNWLLLFTLIMVYDISKWEVFSD